MNKAHEEKQIPPEIEWFVTEQLQIEQTEFDQLGSPDNLIKFRKDNIENQKVILRGHSKRPIWKAERLKTNI